MKCSNFNSISSTRIPPISSETFPRKLHGDLPKSFGNIVAWLIPEVFPHRFLSHCVQRQNRTSSDFCNKVLQLFWKHHNICRIRPRGIQYSFPAQKYRPNRPLPAEPHAHDPQARLITAPRHTRRSCINSSERLSRYSNGSYADSGRYVRVRRCTSPA